MAWLKPAILQHKNHFPSAEGAHVTTETIYKAAQKKQVKTDGDRTLHWFTAWEGERDSEGDMGRG